MNLALPALVILLALLPGFACFYGYFAGRFDRRIAGVSGVEEVAFYVIFAVPIDAFALWACQRFNIALNLDVATHLLTGNLSDASIAKVVAVFQRSSDVSAFTYFLILGSSFLIGSIARRIVWTFRLDTIFTILQLRHEWFYLLQGRLREIPRVVLPYVDVLTKHPDPTECSRLYRGIVVDFELSSIGAIDFLILRNAVRGKGRGELFEWRPIPSDRFAIMGSTIHSINITYIGVDERPKSGWAKWRHNFRAWFRSFVFQEP